MPNPHRHERLEEAVQQAVMEIVHDELQDPRLPMILTVTHVRLTRDLKFAHVYFSQTPDDAEAIDDTLDALDAANGFIRSQVAQRVAMRYTPELSFHYDESGVNAQRIEELLRQEKKKLGDE